nr:hypothetical protein [Tanacetum cinerariifolium]
MTTLADKAILSDADNRPPMLEKDMYDSWKSIMELYMMNRQHGRMILESVEHGPLIWPTIEENGVTRPRKYSELTLAEAIQADCDGRQVSFSTGTAGTYTPGASESNSGKQKTVICYNCKGEGHMSKQCTKPKRKRDDAWFKDKVLMVQAQANGQILHEEELAFLADPEITEVTLVANLSHYGSDVLAKEAVQNSNSSAQQDALILSMIDQLKTQKAQQLEPKIYHGNVIMNTYAITIPDSEETLMLAKESRSKMILKQQDPMVLEKKVNTTLVIYDALNQLSQDFEKRFVPQTELSTEQAFWSQNSMNYSNPSPSCTPTRVEVPKELPKVSMVYTSLKKLKPHLADFDVVVKERTTTTSIIEGSWGFEHTKACFRNEIIPFVKALKDIFNTFDQYLIDEFTKVQNVFHQIEQDVEQHRLESKAFEVKMNQVLNENERFLEQVINKDIVNTVVNFCVDNASVNVHECKKCLKLETELLNKKDFIEKETYDKLFRRYTTLEKHCISLEVDTQLNQEIFQRDNSVSYQKMLKIDMESLAYRLLNNRTSHSKYLEITQEQAMILREVLEQGKSQNPLNNSLDSAREQYIEIQDLKAQLQDNNISISELKKLIEKGKGKSVETKFDKPSVVRQPNAQRIPKPSVLGKPAPFSYSLERRCFSKTKSVPKTNVSEGLSKPVTAQTLPQTASQAVSNTNVLKPGM